MAEWEDAPTPWEDAPDSTEVTTAQDLQGKYSGQVNEISQQKHQMPQGSFRGGMVEGATHNITYNAELMLAAKMGDRSSFPDEIVPGIKSSMALTDEEKKSFDEAKDPGLSSLVTGDKSTAYDKRIAILSEARQRAVDEAYGDSAKDSWAAKIGYFIGNVATDPISVLFPAGRSYKAVAAFGGAIGATQNVTESLSEGKAVDPTDLAISTVIGASGGVAVKGTAELAGKAVKALIQRQSEKGAKLTSEALQSELKAKGVPEADIAQLDLESMSSRLNSEFKLDGIRPEQVLEKRLIDNRTGVTTEDIDLVHQDFYSAKAQEFDPVSYNLPKEHKDTVGYGDVSQKPKYFNGDLTVGTKVDYTNLIDNIDNYTFKKKNRPNVQTEVEGTTQKTRIEAKQNVKGKTSYTPVTTTFEPNAEALDKITADRLSAKQERFNYFTDSVPVGSPTYNKIAAEALESQGGLSPKQYSVSGDPYGTIRGAIENKEIPWTGEIASTYTPPIPDKPLNPNKPDPNWTKAALIKFHEVSGEVVTSPWKAFEAVNHYGKAASKMFDDAYVNTNQRVGTHMVDYDVALEKFKIVPGSPEEQMAADVLRGILKPGEVPPKIFEFSQFLHSKFAGELKESAKTGLISNNTMENLLRKGANKGYFPRVWNYDILETSAGQKLWEERVGGHGFLSEQSAKEAYAAITHSDTGAPISVSKIGDKYFIPLEAIKKAWKDKGIVSSSIRSGHLEAARKFPEELESVLKPFFVQDVKAVYGKYMKDVVGQVEYSKIFGGLDNNGKWNRDANAIRLYEGIRADSEAIGQQFYEAYFQGVGDYSQSKNLQSFLNKNEMVREAAGRLNSLGTLHMLMSQTANLGQTVNALTKVATADALGAKDLFTIYKNGFSKGLKAIWDKDVQREIDRFGATIDHVMIDTFSGLNGTRNTILGNGDMKGMLSPLNYLNNPEKFLKATGFLATEAFNRRMAHTIGVSYTEGLLKKKMELMAMDPSRVNPKKFEQLNKALEEMGIGRDIDPAKVSRAIVERSGELANSSIDMMLGKAGQRFSNKTNFVNASHTMPIFSSSFMGRTMYKFKSFSLHQSQFVVDNIIKPMTRGNFKPAMIALGVGTPVGMGINEARQFFLSDDTEYTNTQKVLRAAGTIGHLTIMADAFNQAVQSPTGFISWVAGPGPTDVSKLGYGTTNTAARLAQGKKDPMQPLIDQIMSITPATRAWNKSLKGDKEAFDSQFGQEEKDQDFSKM